MHIIVCIKSVVIDAPSGKIVRTADKCALNPFDRPALETALQLKASKGGTVTALSMGPPTAEASLREALAMGVDRSVLLCDPALAGSDTLATATALGAAARYLSPFDLLLFGTRSSDSDTGQVGPQTAVILDLPMVANVLQVRTSSQGFSVSRDVDGFREVYEVDLPAVLAIHPTATVPRDPPLGGIAGAYEEQSVETISMDHLDLDPCLVGEAGSPTRVLSMRGIKRERSCRWIEGSPDVQAESLTKALLRAGLIG